MVMIYSFIAYPPMPVVANIILILIIKSTATITTTANIVVTDSDTSQSIDETRLSVSGSAIEM